MTGEKVRHRISLALRVLWGIVALGMGMFFASDSIGDLLSRMVSLSVWGGSAGMAWYWRKAGWLTDLPLLMVLAEGLMLMGAAIGLAVFSVRARRAALVLSLLLFASAIAFPFAEAPLLSSFGLAQSTHFAMEMREPMVWFALVCLAVLGISYWLAPLDKPSTKPGPDEDTEVHDSLEEAG